ncbi:hypothetical protein shim_27980 [Shimia sp. SK013]|uniref:hypothetical protein n=1 Tax=Shimia sp. SK013 TaxID=1389006 RepID=UPI0006B5FD0D|nr:hypothetical protein [Shimia sp. SK013]KPA20882.1 hypothetical protein shim_27980 [Shimia sp. SK013]
MSGEAVTARLYVIVAKYAPTAVVFRRGPTRHFQMLLWDLKTDRITPGQWLKHRVYTENADLSPDGRFLIYNAATYSPNHQLGGGYVAISKPPFFTALALYPTPEFEEGGCFFLGNRRFWVGSSAEDLGKGLLLRSNGLRRVPRFPETLLRKNIEDWPFARRDGWTNVAMSVTKGEDGRLLRRNWTMDKGLGEGFTLTQMRTQMLSYKIADLRAKYPWQSFELHSRDGVLELHAEWADVWRNDVLFAREGCLFRMRAGEKPSLVANLNANKFVSVRAPYAGLQTARRERNDPKWYSLRGEVH